MHPNYRFDLDRHLGDVSQLTVLNVGAGHCSSPISTQFLTLHCKWLTNVEVYGPVFDELSRLPFDSPTENIRSEGLAYCRGLVDRSFDIVVSLDVIEHFTKEDGLALLSEMKRVARKQVVVFMPCNECPQGDYEGNPWQRHLSTWLVSDFEGWKAEYYPDFHTHVNPPADAGWFVWTRGEDINGTKP